MVELLLIKQESDLLNEARTLFREYEAELNENLCFQSFEAELENPLKKYGPPNGLLYIAKYNDEIAGCIALYPLQQQDECEMKRLYVRPAFRKQTIGKILVEQLLQDAVLLGYKTMKLDTLQKLQPAIQLYKQFSFEETPAYYENPLPGVVYMQKHL